MTDWVFGRHSVRALLAEDVDRVRRVIVAGENPEIRALAEEAQRLGLRLERRDRATLDRLTNGGNHQSIAAECAAITAMSETAFEAMWPSMSANPLLLVLDGVQDPRNLGACLRTADAAGVDAVLLPKRGGAPLSSTVAKTSSGAIGRLNLVEVSNLARRLKWLKERGVWLVGATERGSARYDRVDLSGAIAVVMGSEDKGLRRLTADSCDFLVEIPMHGSVSSLNVSVATGIVLFEARRQRGQ